MESRFYFSHRTSAEIFLNGPFSGIKEKGIIQKEEIDGVFMGYSIFFPNRVSENSTGYLTESEYRKLDF